MKKCCQFSFSLDSNSIFGKIAPCQLLHPANLVFRTAKLTSKSTQSRAAYLISWVHKLVKNDVTFSLDATRLEHNLVMAESLNKKS